MFHFFENINFGHFPYAALSPMVWLLILVALTFDFLNGLHDCANSIATIVSTRVLSPSVAVIWAAAGNFIVIPMALESGKSLQAAAAVTGTAMLIGAISTGIMLRRELGAVAS